MTMFGNFRSMVKYIVYPLYKSGDHSERNYYKSISIHPFVSKIGVGSVWSFLWLPY